MIPAEPRWTEEPGRTPGSSPCRSVNLSQFLRPLSPRAHGIGWRATCPTCGWRADAVTREAALEATERHLGRRRGAE